MSPSEEQRILQWEAMQALENINLGPFRWYVHTPVDIEQVKREALEARELMKEQT